MTRKVKPKRRVKPVVRNGFGKLGRVKPRRVYAASAKEGEAVEELDDVNGWVGG